jgi:nucleoside-diphosphate kinase
MGFYYVHKERPFYNELVSYMARSPIVVLVLEKEGAIANGGNSWARRIPRLLNRETIRKQFGSAWGKTQFTVPTRPSLPPLKFRNFFAMCELL